MSACGVHIDVRGPGADRHVFAAINTVMRRFGYSDPRPYVEAGSEWWEGPPPRFTRRALALALRRAMRRLPRAPVTVHLWMIEAERGQRHFAVELWP